MASLPVGRVDREVLRRLSIGAARVGEGARGADSADDAPVFYRDQDRAV